MKRILTIVMVCGPCITIGQELTDYYQEPCKLSIGYWENLGQVVDSNRNPVSHVKYYSEGAQPRTLLSDSSRITFAMTIHDGIPATMDTMYNIHMTATGEGSRYSTPQGYDQKSHYKNFFLDYTAPDGATNVPGYDWVYYEEFIKDIDLKFYSGSAGAKMTFICRPGFEPADLILAFQGQDSLHVDVNGSLQMYRDGRWLELRQAQAYQVDDLDNIVPLNWSAEYQVSNGQGVVTFEFDTYDPDLPLLLQAGPEPLAGSNDPEGVCWGTYFGGDDGEHIYSSTTDSDGNYYVVGYSLSAFVTFPQDVGIQLVPSGEAAFLTKFLPNHKLEWTVFWGGEGDKTAAWAVAAKSPQEIYVTGYTVDNNLFDWPQGGAYNDQSASGVDRKAIIGKFNENGLCLWSTYFGDGKEEALGIAIDAQERLVIVGYTDGINLPAPAQPMTGASSWSYAGGTWDGFIAMFGSTDQLLWSTPYGSDQTDAATDVRATASGFAVSGWTTGNVPPVDGGTTAYEQGTNAGGTDVFVQVFNQNALCIWATPVGGSGEDLPGTNSLTIAPGGDILLVGGTTSTDFPLEPGPDWWDYTNAGQAGFILRFENGTWDQLWGTYVSGTGENFLECVTTDDISNIYVAGYTEDEDLPLTELVGVYHQDALISDVQGTPQAGLDAMLMVFTPDHWLVHSTYVGGGSGYLGENIYTIEWSDALLYAGGHTSKHTDPFSVFPLHNPGAPAWYDDLYFYPSTYDGFIVALCTDLFTGVAERGLAEASGRLLVKETGPGLYTVTGWNIGDRLLTVHDAAGKCIQRIGIGANQRSATVNLAHATPGVYVLRSEGASPLTVKIVRR